MPLQVPRLPERALAVWALVIASLHVDRADVRPQAVCVAERTFTVRAFVIALLHVNHADVLLQVACRLIPSLAVWALVVPARAIVVAGVRVWACRALGR